MLGGLLGTMVSFTGIGAVVGVGWVAFNVGFRAMRSGKNNLINWIRETMATSKMLAAKILEVAIANARPTIQLRYREHLKQQVEATQKQIRQAEQEAKADKASRERRCAILEKNITIIQKNISTAEILINQLLGTTHS